MRVIGGVWWSGEDKGSWSQSLKRWNLKNGKKPTVEPAGRCLSPDSTGLLQRAPASADDGQNWPRFGILILDTRVNMHEANEMEETLEQPFGLLELWGFSSFNWQELVHVVNGVKSVVVNGITTWVGTSSLISRVWVIDLNMFEESSEEHGIWKSRLTILSHAHHSVDYVVGEVEGFSDGETIKHVAKRHVWMIFVTSVTNDIFIENKRIGSGLSLNKASRTKDGDSKDLSKILKSENGFDIVNSKPYTNGSVKVSNETEAPIELKDDDGTNLLVNVE
ncbi:hypothetical protein Tco_0425137 [Tanacetum coccineum]